MPEATTAEAPEVVAAAPAADEPDAPEREETETPTAAERPAPGLGGRLRELAGDMAQRSVVAGATGAATMAASYHHHKEAAKVSMRQAWHDMSFLRKVVMVGVGIYALAALAPVIAYVGIPLLLVGATAVVVETGVNKLGEHAAKVAARREDAPDRKAPEREADGPERGVDSPEAAGPSVRTPEAAAPEVVTPDEPAVAEPAARPTLSPEAQKLIRSEVARTRFWKAEGAEARYYIDRLQEIGQAETVAEGQAIAAAALQPGINPYTDTPLHAANAFRSREVMDFRFALTQIAENDPSSVDGMRAEKMREFADVSAIGNGPESVAHTNRPPVVSTGTIPSVADNVPAPEAPSVVARVFDRVGRVMRRDRGAETSEATSPAVVPAAASPALAVTRAGRTGAGVDSGHGL